MKHIFITGANRGIGLELTQQFLKNEHQVWATCRKPDAASALHKLKQSFPKTLEIVPCDVASMESIEAARDTVTHQTKHLDWLINNAAQGGLETLDDVSFSQGLPLFQINALAPIIIARAFIPLLKKGTHPTVINISSVLGSVPLKENEEGRWVDGYVYPATKAALNIMSRQLYKDLKPHNIAVISQSPGWVRTDLGGEAAPLSVTEACASLIEFWSHMTPDAHNGQYLSETGEPLPYG